MNTTGKFQVERTVTIDVIEADQHLFPNPWTDSHWLNLDLNQNVILTWRKEDSLVGYALFQIVNGDDTAHLLKILVRPEFRGGQFTGDFWSNILTFLRSRKCRSIYLEVEASNGRAISFYNRMGFKLLRRNKAYYSNGEDALMMSLTL